MTRLERLEFCNKCLNREFDPKQGLICKLTGKIADFEDQCAQFERDVSVPEKNSENTEISDKEIYIELDGHAVTKLKRQQDFYYAIVGGAIAALVSAVIWAVVTVGTHFQIGFMAIGVGLLVGYAVRFFGAGIDRKFGYLGALLSLLGCLCGNLFTQVGFIAQQESLGYFETLTYLNFGLIVDILVETFSPMDIFFYAIALVEGYKLSFRKVSTQEVLKLQNEDYQGHPSFYKYRLPLVIASIALIGAFFISLKMGVSGHKVYEYESGMKMSEGDLVHSKEHGKWTYWYENGQLNSTGYFVNGLPDSLWQWFDESGLPEKIGHYKNGLEHGVWIYYYENGQQGDSGAYLAGRKEGPWKTWFEDGVLFQAGPYKADHEHGQWISYHENGNLNAEGEYMEGDRIGEWHFYYENGQPASIIEYLPGERMLIMNSWDEEGNQVIVDGNGLYEEYSTDGLLLTSGNVEHGIRVGTWTSYYSHGGKKEVGIYEDDKYRILHSWSPGGLPEVRDGNGLYTSYHQDEVSRFESGQVVNGARQGPWQIFFSGSDQVYQALNYEDGELNGWQAIYYESGEVFSMGEMHDGKREGEWSWYHENGELSSTVSYHMDKKEGKQIIWSETGDKVKEEYYENGELVEEKIL